ncbi:MAG: Clp1/GlmU family protein [Chloroflexota bacterium]
MSMSALKPVDAIVPQPAWRRIDLAGLQGTVMILGDTDTGKSTLARYLYLELCRLGRRVAYLDGDVGQSSLGLPATLTIALGQDGSPTFPPDGPRAVFFVGSVSPRGHMLPVVVGAHKLQDWAVRQGAQVVVMDTSGMVDAAVGGGALKQWKIELLQPTTLIALARGAELEHILLPLRRRPSLRLYEWPVAAAVGEKSRQARIAHRQACFRRYFADASSHDLSLEKLPVIGLDGALRGRLLALQDEAGFALALAVIENLDARRRTLTVRTPFPAVATAASLRVGDLWLETASGRQLA